MTVILLLVKNCSVKKNKKASLNDNLMCCGIRDSGNTLIKLKLRLCDVTVGQNLNKLISVLRVRLSEGLSSIPC